MWEQDFTFIVHFLLVFLPPPFSSCPLSGRAHGAFGAALVDGDGLYSSWNGGLRLSCLPPLSHHHLLQGHQEVGGFLLDFSSALRVNLSIDDEFMTVNLELWQPDHLMYPVM